MEHDLAKAINMKLIIYLFKQLSGLKINFYKSEISFLVRLRMKKIIIGIYLDVKFVLFHSTSWEYLFIIGGC
jgi:hypothetical protein